LIPAHIVYLHGFASSPGSSKARFLAEKLAARGIELVCPDLNEPDFSTLTVTRMFEQVERLVCSLPGSPVTLIGSSLGGFAALHVAARDAAASGRIDRLVLIAPALDFGRNRMSRLGEEGFESWRRTGRLDVAHHATGRIHGVHFELYEDAGRYDSFAVRFDEPILIFQGRNDEAVDCAMVERFAGDRPNVSLRLNTYLLRWAMAKYRKLRSWKRALRAMRDGVRRQPRFFAHWAWVKPAVRGLGTTRAV
jgi:uncharacterized protein